MQQHKNMPQSSWCYKTQSSNMQILTKSLAETSKKLVQSPNPRGLTEVAWPPLPGNGPQRVSLGHTLAPLHCKAIQADPKVAQHVALATKQLLIEYGLLDKGEEPYPKSVKAQKDLWKHFNNWFDRYAMTETTEGQALLTPSRAIRNITIFDCPTILLEFDSAESKVRLVDMVNKDTHLLNEINPKVHIQRWTYVVIFRFVLCTGIFDPSIDDHLCDLEKENDLPANSIAAASRCKHPDRRLPSQTTTTLKVACVNPDVANQLFTGCICIDNHLINVHKDIWIPVRCIKCQGYGHTQDVCIGIMRCANCTSEFHRVDVCDKQLSCVLQARFPAPSTSPACLVFMQKCDVLDMCFPKNSMPYFPSNDSWTWASRPTNPPLPENPLPPLQQASPRHRSIRPVCQQP